MSGNSKGLSQRMGEKGARNRERLVTGRRIMEWGVNRCWLYFLPAPVCWLYRCARFVKTHQAGYTRYAHFSVFMLYLNKSFQMGDGEGGLTKSLSFALYPRPTNSLSTPFPLPHRCRRSACFPFL